MTKLTTQTPTTTQNFLRFLFLKNSFLHRRHHIRTLWRRRRQRVTFGRDTVWRGLKNGGTGVGFVGAGNEDASSCIIPLKHRRMLKIVTRVFPLSPMPNIPNPPFLYRIHIHFPRPNTTRVGP